jgi:hypothetical protein
MVAQTNEEKEFSFTKWLAEGIEGMRPRRLMPRMVPEEVKGHLRAARRETLLAVRAVLDKAIERLEQEPAAPKKVTRIKVE